MTVINTFSIESAESSPSSESGSLFHFNNGISTVYGYNSNGLPSIGISKRTGKLIYSVSESFLLENWGIIGYGKYDF